MKRKITALALAVLVFSALGGCVSAETEDETSAPDTETETVEDITAEPQTDDIKYFDVRRVEGGYAYTLFNLDGSVAEEVDFCEECPSHELLKGNILKVTVGSESYYYDLENRVFSDTFNDVFDENGTLLVRAEGQKLVICDIFDEGGFYTELVSFTYEFSQGVDVPFVDVEFIDGGQSVKCEYLSGVLGERMSECFNITSGTKSVIVSDWRNKKDLIPATEREAVESYLFSYMGTVDYNTGFPYDYEVSGSLVINGVRYYHCECFYVMENDDGTTNNVSCARFVLSEDKQQVFDCRDKDGELIIYTENDFH